MSYNWEGDVILQDTAIGKKRYVIGRKQPITTDIREWISFQDNIIMKEILACLREKHGLPTTKKPGDFDERAMVVWRFVAGNVTYVHDTTQYKKDDFWLFPPETYQIGKGDCEDGSFLLASLLIAGGISPFCVRVTLGRAYDGTGKPLGGHCWPIYKNEAGRWCILESTLGKIPSRMPEADELSGEGQPFRYEPLFCFNGHHLWEIFLRDSGKTGERGLKKYFKARTKRVDMRKVSMRLAINAAQRT
jgi:Transglutaminase-like superfamily